MIKALSILIPTYNRALSTLVQALAVQAAKVEGLEWEVIVADDASTNDKTKTSNRIVNDCPNCRLIELSENMGRVRIRNFLTAEARYAHLLFLDSDVLVTHDDFILRYLTCDNGCVVYGGVCITPSPHLEQSNLRYRYEWEKQKSFTLQWRRQHPYKSFRTTNFLVPRKVMLAHPFDDRIRAYGYEDVLFGKELAKAGVSISHIDNAVAVDDFESDALFLDKVDESLRTLSSIRTLAVGYSSLLDSVLRLQRWHVLPLVRSLLKPFRPMLRLRLTKNKGSVHLLQAYRFITLIHLF